MIIFSSISDTLQSKELFKNNLSTLISWGIRFVFDTSELEKEKCCLNNSQKEHIIFKFDLSFTFYTHFMPDIDIQGTEPAGILQDAKKYIVDPVTAAQRRTEMTYQAVFKRYEMKYMMTRRQRKAVLEAMLPHMKLDDFGHTTIRNVYFDTDSYILVRRSIEKPVYKEKLRIRSYKKAEAQDEVFIELKKKYDDVVYKRRESLSQLETLEWLGRGTPFPKSTQIGNEIDYFFHLYQTLRPKVFLSYEREAFYALDGSDLRVTFDENILARQEELALSREVWGEPLTDADKVLMEIKTSGGIPLWMTHVLAQEKIYKTSFSKYGTAYEKMICGKQTETTGKVIIA